MTRAIVCDTSGLLALLDAADPAHDAAVRVVQHATGVLVVSPFVLAELDYVVRARLGPEAARRLGADVVAGAYELAKLTAADVAVCLDLDERYLDLGLGLTDASLVVLAGRYGTTELFSLDERHLRAVRPLVGESFRMLPADLD